MMIIVSVISTKKRYCPRNQFIRYVIMLLYSFLLPYLTYCIEVCGSAFDSYCSGIVKVQKKTVRIFVSANRLARSEFILKLLNILMFRQLYIYSLQMFMYKHNSGILPSILTVCLNIMRMFTVTINTNTHISGNFRKYACVL